MTLASDSRVNKGPALAQCACTNPIHLATDTGSLNGLTKQCALTTPTQRELKTQVENVTCHQKAYRLSLKCMDMLLEQL